MKTDLLTSLRRDYNGEAKVMLKNICTRFCKKMFFENITVKLKLRDRPDSGKTMSISLLSQAAYQITNSAGQPFPLSPMYRYLMGLFVLIT